MAISGTALFGTSTVASLFRCGDYDHRSHVICGLEPYGTYLAKALSIWPIHPRLHNKYSIRSGFQLLGFRVQPEIFFCHFKDS